jgi:GNAT superfamily N-acetyltransferase
LIEYKIEALVDRQTVERILRALPEWFGIESAILDYCRDAETLPTYFAVGPDGMKIGFVCLKFNNEFTAEIHVMGVLKEFQGYGVGTTLVNQASEIARETGHEFMMVKTLGPSHPDLNYASTRKFYAGMGFRPLDEFDSIWPGNPCLIMAKNL